MLEGLKIVVDVQHLYRSGIHRGDRGTVFRHPDGTTSIEADMATHYALTLADALRSRGATVWSNDPGAKMLIGPYWSRTAQAMALGADVYLACHVNAGGGSYARAEYMAGSTGEPIARAVVEELARVVPEVKSRQVVPLRRGQRGAVCIEGFVGAGIILEPFFGDSLANAPLTTLAGLERVGRAIADGITHWWRDWNPAARRVA